MKNILLLISITISSFGLAQNISMQNGTVNQCSGTFYDSGGEFGNYSNNENFEFTICSDVAGDFVQLDFTQFSTQLNIDVLTIYDGDDTSATVLGTFSGTSSPNTITASSTNPSGCLTITFSSDGSGNTTGWEADIACYTPCQDIAASIDSTNPAAVSGIIEVDPGEIINFQGSATFSDDGTGASYSWDFGNGNSLPGATVNYSYPNPGTYSVTLTVTDSNPLGCSDSVSNIIVDVLDNDACAGSLPICDGIVDVPSPVGSGTAEAGIDYGCLGSQPRPRWYFLQTGDVAGDLSFTLSQTTGQGGSGTGIDVDFIIWGPFEEPVCGPSNLNSSTQVDCSFSGSSVEQIDIPSAPANSYYVLLITNYSSSSGYINLELNPDPLSEATTNCDIICQVDLGEDQNLCNGSDYEINPEFTGSFNSFEWQLDGVTIPGETNSTLTATQSGTYTLIAQGFDAIFGDPCEAQDEITIGIADNFAVNNVTVSECSAATSAEFNLDAEAENILNPLDASDYTVTFHTSQSDADNNVAPISDSDAYTGADDEVLYARVLANGTDCFSTAVVTLNIAGQPEINLVTDLEVCDDLSNNGLGEFDLSVQTLGILGGQTTSDFVVSYHLSFSDADAGTAALPLSYTSSSNAEPIYVRVESVADANCYNASVDPVFNLIVNYRAIANQPSNMEVCDDTSNDGISTFDLSTQDSAILGAQDPSIYTVSYHVSLADAEANVSPLPSNYTNTAPNIETIYVRVEDPSTPQCYGTTSFDLIINTLPEVVAVNPLEICDDNNDGFTAFTLSSKIDELLNGQTGVAVTFHESMSGADTNSDEIFDGYVNTTMNSQFVYVRLEDTTTSCYNIASLDLVVLNNPVANTTSALEVCDTNSDGFSAFDLSLKDAEVVGSQTGMVVSYHQTQATAETGTEPLPTTYTNTVVDAQQIFVRIQDGNTGCYDTTTLQLIVNSQPTLVSVTPYELCDYTNASDEQEVFDLSTKDAEIINGQVNVSVAYYETQDEADAAVNAITTGYTNTSNPQNIVAVLTNGITGCRSTTTFNLVVNPLPQVVDPTPLEVCDDATADGTTEIDLSLKNTEITGNNSDYSVSYYGTQSDAEAEVNPLPLPYTNTSNPEVVVVRVEDITTGCYATTTLELIVEQAPVAFTPEALRYCDPDNDGFGVFNLTAADNAITGGASGVTVSYHETLANASNGVDAIADPLAYSNIVVSQQTLYARVESATVATSCATVVELELIVEPTPQIESPTALETCDDTAADGFAMFDLTTKEAEVLDGQDSGLFTISYYDTQANAETSNNPIGNVTAYTNSTAFNQTLWIRVEYTATIAVCYKLVSLELIVHPLPEVIQPTALELCDDLGESPGDEQTVFNLREKDTEITSGNGSLVVSYYETQADAQSQSNVIATPTQYTNTSVNGLAANPQTLYVVVSDIDTGCVDYTTLTLRVLPNPTPTPSDQLPDIALCDVVNTGDGVEVFDLTENETLILNGETGVTPSYHESAEDADEGINAIVDPTQYTNILSPEQDIYVRVTNDTSGCYAVVSFTIRVHPLPAVVAVTDFIYCELNTDGIASFDLTAKDAEVLNGQDPLQYVVSYHISLADAQSQSNALVSPYTNLSNPQQLFVAITNTDTSCSISTQSFNIEVQEAAEANPDMVAIVYEQCDDTMQSDDNPANDSVQFDLTTQNVLVLDGQDPVNYKVTYFATEAEANFNVNPLPYLYENIVNPQVIYARVDNDTPDSITGSDSSICYAVAPLTLQVNPLPELNLQDGYILCIDTNGTEVLGAPVIDTGLSETTYSFEWSYNGEFLPGETGSNITPDLAGTYSVTVTDTSTSTATSCSSTDTTEVIESAPPELEVNLVTQAFADNHIVEAQATGIGVYEYSLDGGPWQDQGVFTNVSPGEHQITARDKNGCGSTTKPIYVIDYPLYFTPNGDGNNDRWNIGNIGSSAKIYIFDRYGKLLKQLSPTGSGWNGTFNGMSMPTNDYWFTVIYNEPLTGERKEFKAHFTLKR